MLLNCKLFHISVFQITSHYDAGSLNFCGIFPSSGRDVTQRSSSPCLVVCAFKPPPLLLIHTLHGAP